MKSRSSFTAKAESYAPESTASSPFSMDSFRTKGAVVWVITYTSAGTSPAKRASTSFILVESWSKSSPRHKYSTPWGRYSWMLGLLQ